MSTTTANALIEVQQHPTLGPAVSGRAVYAITSVSTASRDIFADWFRGNQRKLNLIEKVDFETTSVILPGSPRKCIEHILTIDAARRIAEVALKKRGVELAAYLKYYAMSSDPKEITEVPTPSPADYASMFGSFTGTTSIAEATTRPIEPQPAPAVATPLSPAQQLLIEVQKLVEAEQKRNDEPEVLPELLKVLEGRLNQLEQSVGTMLNYFQQSATALRGLALAQLPCDTNFVPPLPDLEPTKRTKINRLVDGYAAAKTVTHQEVWKHLYGHLSSRFGFDAWQHTQSKKNPNYLEIVEENGQLENLYSIAVELLTLSQR